MEEHGLNPWEHDHSFGQDEKKPGEARTLIVVLLTAATMVLEIVVSRLPRGTAHGRSSRAYHDRGMAAASETPEVRGISSN